MITPLCWTASLMPRPQMIHWNIGAFGISWLPYKDDTTFTAQTLISWSISRPNHSSSGYSPHGPTLHEPYDKKNFDVLAAMIDMFSRCWASDIFRFFFVFLSFYLSPCWNTKGFRYYCAGRNATDSSNNAGGFQASGVDHQKRTVLTAAR